MIGQMTALEFPAFGSIHFQDAPIDPALKIYFDDGFCIGPSCNPVLWNCRLGEMELYGNSGQSHGPCKSTTERNHYRRKLTLLPRAKHARVLHWIISICSFPPASRRLKRHQVIVLGICCRTSENPSRQRETAARASQGPFAARRLKAYFAACGSQHEKHIHLGHQALRDHCNHRLAKYERGAGFHVRKRDARLRESTN
jgi:hypothetical protein